MEAVKPAIDQYERFLPNPLEVEQELDRWQLRWTRIPEKDRPKNLKDTIHVMDFAMRTMHPNIWALYKILETLIKNTNPFFYII